MNAVIVVAWAVRMNNLILKNNILKKPSFIKSPSMGNTAICLSRGVPALTLLVKKNTASATNSVSVVLLTASASVA